MEQGEAGIGVTVEQHNDAEAVRGGDERERDGDQAQTGRKGEIEHETQRAKPTNDRERTRTAGLVPEACGVRLTQDRPSRAVERVCNDDQAC